MQMHFLPAIGRVFGRPSWREILSKSSRTTTTQLINLFIEAHRNSSLRAADLSGIISQQVDH